MAQASEIEKNILKFIVSMYSGKNIIVITENGIAERGTHEFLLQKGGIYAKYYQM